VQFPRPRNVSLLRPPSALCLRRSGMGVRRPPEPQARPCRGHRRALLLVVVVAAAVFAGLLAFAPPAAAAAGDFVISGQGNGHAMGLSQWGAWVAARQGVGYKKILSFYYPGTTLTSLKDSGRSVKIRVTRHSNSTSGYYRVDLKPTVTAASLVMHSSSGSKTRKLAAGASVGAVYSGGKVKIVGMAGTFDWIEVRPASTSGRVAVALKAASSSSSAYRIEYWGKIRVERNGGYNSLRVYNTLLLERYLRGVAEIDPGWANSKLPAQYAPECVKAQQVAARTYAVYHSTSAYLYDNTLDQVYLGYTWEAAHPGVKTAVDATKGLVLTYRGKTIGAYFSAHSGGYLTDSAWSSNGAPGYIVAKPDPWSLQAPVKPWAANPGYSWTCTISPASLTAKLKNVVKVGTVTKVQVIARDTPDPGSHAAMLRITGTAGSATISARTFKAKLGLKSTLILSITKEGLVDRYQQTDPRLDYSGRWQTFTTTPASGGSYLRASAKGASLTVTFKGTYLAWIATKGTTLGKAYVSLDGKTAVKVDLARGAVAYQQKVWNTGTLASGVHTVKIWWCPANKAGKYISIDAFEVKGTLR
jgi:stage II sporulation protein D